MFRFVSTVQLGFALSSSRPKIMSRSRLLKRRCNSVVGGELNNCCDNAQQYILLKTMSNVTKTVLSTFLHPVIFGHSL